LLTPLPVESPTTVSPDEASARTEADRADRPPIVASDPDTVVQNHVRPETVADRGPQDVELGGRVLSGRPWSPGRDADGELRHPVPDRVVSDHQVDGPASTGGRLNPAVGSARPQTVDPDRGDQGSIPPIHITIGRIEIAAPAPRPAPKPVATHQPRPRYRPPISLEEYLEP
jgi:hypothetical protein